MDIALKSTQFDFAADFAFGFNPYSDGYCSEIYLKSFGLFFLGFVSILILMDIALKSAQFILTDSNQFRFQSLFWWILLWNHKPRVFMISLAPLFQSLFWWILLWNSFWDFSICFCRICFNPYSDGYCSEIGGGRSMRAVFSMFQSLFWWILLWNLITRWSTEWIRQVSILILMDIALKCQYERNIMGSVYEFQSLFWWILLWNNGELNRQSGKGTEFQSLFWWILLWNRSNRWAGQSGWALFQSLFWWILLWNQVGNRYHLRGLMVFQSLFWWILLWNPFEMRVNVIRKTCFNPYSDGYCSEIRKRRCFHAAACRFQSLFWWILLWNIFGKDRRSDLWAVSILILMDIALKFLSHSQSLHLLRSFNPYSDGYCSEIHAPVNDAALFSTVLILILMDIALKSPRGVSVRCGKLCFNPYSDGYCSEIGRCGG